jgi:hypothetical protein
MPCLRDTAAGAASDRLGLPRPGQAFALSHFSNASRSAPHWTGHEQDKAGSGDGDKECKIFFRQPLQGHVPRTRHRTRERRQLLYLSLMVLRVHLYAGDLFKVMQ